MSLDPQPKIGAYGVDNDRGASLDSAPMSSGRHPRWCVVITKYGQHEPAEQALSADGWQTYFPLHCDIRHGHRLGPLFGNYAFVHADLERDDWPRIFRTRHVFTLLARDRRPLVVPIGIVEHLQARTSARRVVDDPGEHSEASRIRAGAAVEVLDGPWRQFVGICTLSRRDRLTVLLGLFGRSTPVEFRHDQVIAA